MTCQQDDGRRQLGREPGVNPAEGVSQAPPDGADWKSVVDDRIFDRSRAAEFPGVPLEPARCRCFTADHRLHVRDVRVLRGCQELP